MQLDPPRKPTSSTTFTPLSQIAAGLAGLSALYLATPAGAEPGGSATRPAAAETRVEGGNLVILRPGEAPGATARVFAIGDGDGKSITIQLVDANEDPDAGDDAVVRRLRERRSREATKETDVSKRPDGDKVANDAAKKDEAKSDKGEEKDAPDSSKQRRVLEGLAKARRQLQDAERSRSDADKKVKDEKSEKVAFLGINPAPVPPALARQLKLPADLGLVVDQVQSGSPADQAGIRQYDVLQKLDDQLLVDTHQLVVLVRSHKAGETVSLTGVREGKPFTAKAKLGEHEAVAEAREQEEGGPELKYHLVPPNGGPPGPNGLWKPEPPTVIPLPLAPGRPMAPPPLDPFDGKRIPEARQREEKDSDEDKPQPKVAPPARPGAPGEEGRAGEQGEQEVRALREQLQSLRATAEKLRAQVNEEELRARQSADEARHQRQEAEAARKKAQDAGPGAGREDGAGRQEN